MLIRTVDVTVRRIREKIEKERKVEYTIGNIKRQMGNNTILKGMNYEEGATTGLRNKLIGGHNA